MELEEITMEEGVISAIENGETGVVAANEETETSQEEATQQEGQKEPEKERLDKEALAVQKAINRKHAQLMAEREERSKLEAKIAELERRIQPKQDEIPPIPDQFDPDFDAKLAARDKAIIERTKAEYESSKADMLRRQSEIAEYERRNAELSKHVATYNAKTKEYGLDPVALEDHARTLQAYNISPEIARFILEEEKGPLLTEYLGKNLEELEKVTSMSAVRAGTYISTNILPKLEGKQAKAPIYKPTGDLSANGAVKKKERLLDGVTFE